MALQVDFNLCQTDNCGTLTAHETTGAYNAVSNEGGWGSPNIAWNTSGMSAIFTVVDSAGTTTEYDVTGSIANNNGLTIFDLASIIIPDGAFTVNYTVSTSSESSSVTKKFFSYCTVRCCVFKKMRDAVTKANCNCEKDLSYELYLWSIYKAMQFAASGCNYPDAELLLEELQLACDTGDCGCN